MDDRADLSAEILDARPPGRDRWAADAVGPKVGGWQGGPPASIIGTVTSEIDALARLVAGLERNRPATLTPTVEP